MLRPKQVPYKRKRTPPCSPMASAMYNLPIGTALLEHQVAGHTFQEGKDDVGMLKDQQDGSILKPAYKKVCGVREIEFYEQLQREPPVSMLKELVPDYRGMVTMDLGDRPINFIRLADITHGMTEPCVIDIKIGKRTWDPLASPEKIAAEEQKYQACKQNLGICIPGFQVYSVKTGNVKRFGKDFGKKLNQTTITDALKIFLNTEYGTCRQLLVQFLSGLWNIQKFARTQKKLRFYSSSILLAYDARFLRNSLESQKKCNNGLEQLNDSSTFTLKRRPPTPDHNDRCSAWSNKGTLNGSGVADPMVPVEIYKKVQRSHSSQNNYDEDLKLIRENYAFMLDNLIGGGCNNKEWAFVKMIDFAHVFPSDDDTLDTNYLFGVESLVKIFEEFLQDCYAT